ncbi:hypothetical protein JCM18920_1252 [Cutibacterium acnes JCM 18920]|uniref:MFS transporter n=1 Tax=Cutibacterium acnes TaxID=1747 RepID=A0AA44U2M3_CUTAC|nr:hypothetical protein HMPREF9619_00117 [Cutibacterium acnes HL082PA2]EFT64466.1 hypothetical protein HMPREF9578_01564 [Cutibacterium acnes HL110PA4]EFT74871.1 hypothetical protein HMPREF9599_01275 [Cutibacterium acnes HL050PA2]EGE70341.1 hypothetical protein HMPREF9341_00045 [Cutibacterium acnes HL103PA1]PEN27683.1 MFS transporter [Cutibacterium acnes]PGF24625.1 MFS transporter [Cutibacterium acnes subsp. defendens]GAE79661.1 hypothetical protein JCM18920_1252 [Cutibacterium acnes JCM 18920
MLGDGSQIGHGEYLARVVAVAPARGLSWFFPQVRTSVHLEVVGVIWRSGREAFPLPAIPTVMTRSGWTSQWFRGDGERLLWAS